MKRSNSFHSGQIQSSVSRYNLAPIPEEPRIAANDTFSPTSSDNNSRIKVVIRVRPLTNKEKGSGEKIIVQDATKGEFNHSGSSSNANNSCSRSLAVWDPACLTIASQQQFDNSSTLDPNYWAKTFHFDRILWSVDPSAPSYASQSTVFEELGQPVIDMAMSGYNCCVMAYGQTGGGKTYTMSNVVNQRDPNEFGLIPRICFGLFEALETNQFDDQDDEDENAEENEEQSVSNKTSSNDIHVTFSHIEIYNDNVRDLLAPGGGSAGGTGFLKVREHPVHGIFVAGLTVVKVSSFEDVMSLISIGDKNRTIASTNVNTHSSRSHAIVNLTITQRSRAAAANNQSNDSNNSQKYTSTTATSSGNRTNKSKSNTTNANANANSGKQSSYFPAQGSENNQSSSSSSSSWSSSYDVYLPTSEIQQKVSKVYLVDLAGSERVTISGARGDRLKEANHINISLSVLGDVIKSLGDLTKKNTTSSSSSLSGKQLRNNDSTGYKNDNTSGFIPYRNSTLTMILKESLGGNSHAIMVCAVSPSSSDYEETLSTLKYADRVSRRVILYTILPLLLCFIMYNIYL